MKTVFTSEQATWPLGQCLPDGQYKELVLLQDQLYKLKLETLEDAKKPVTIGELHGQVEASPEIDKIMRTKPRYPKGARWCG